MGFVTVEVIISVLFFGWGSFGDGVRGCFCFVRWLRWNS